METKIKKLGKRQTKIVESSSQRVKSLTFNSQLLWPMYKRQFKAAAEINCKNKEKRLFFTLFTSFLYFIFLAVPQFLCWYCEDQLSSCLQNTSKHHQKNYCAIINALELWCGKKQMSVAYQSMLKSRGQKSVESL